MLNEIVAVVKLIGLRHNGAGLQVILETQPAWVPVPSEVNTKVKHPLAALEVNVGGITVPV